MVACLDTMRNPSESINYRITTAEALSLMINNIEHLLRSKI